MKLRLILLLALAVGAGRAPAAEPNITPAAAVPTASSPPPVGAAPNRRAAPGTGTTSAPANDSSIAASAPYEAFRIITDRNIFNPNRTGRRQITQEAPPRPDTITLVGTMDSDKGLRAFFDVSISRAKPSQAVRVGESVEKFKVTKITPKAIDVERDGKTLPVRVGQQFRRPPGGDWDLVGEDVVLREAQARAALETKSDPMAPVVIPANASPAERALMERRNQSLISK